LYCGVVRENSAIYYFFSFFDKKIWKFEKKDLSLHPKNDNFKLLTI